MVSISKGRKANDGRKDGKVSETILRPSALSKRTVGRDQWIINRQKNCN